VQRFMTRWGHWEWAVAMVAALLLAVSFWDWYAVTFAVAVGSQNWTQTLGVDAWHASTAWSAAVLFGVAAAFLVLVHGVGLLTGAWVRVVDDLVSLHRPGYAAGVQPGFQIGVLLLAAELGVVLRPVS
jgi:hypothetical protein